MRKTIILALVAVAGVASANTWDSGTGLGWAVTDNATFNFNFNPTTLTPGTVTQFDIFWGPAHTWRGDLQISLTNNVGNTVALYNREDGSGDMISVFFSDSGVAIPTSGNLDSATTGSLYLPTGGGTLSSLGTSGPGTWTLTVTDNAGGDTGTIDRVRVTTAPVPEPASMAVLGLGAAALLRRRKNKKA